jgi:hypothetical protein
MAWLKHRPDQPIPIVNYEEAKSSYEFPISYYMTMGASFFIFGKILKELAYKVPWFEREVVRRYLITDDMVNNQPIISAQSEIEKLLRQVMSFYFKTFILLLLGYLIPETRYPNLFIFWNYFGEIEMNDPSILRQFIVPLFIILLAHHNWCGVVLSVVIYYVRVISYEIMKSYLSGEFWGGRNRFLVEILSAVKKIGEEITEHSRVVLGREPESLVEFYRMLIDYWRAH